MLNFLKIIGTAIFYPESDNPKAFESSRAHRQPVTLTRSRPPVLPQIGRPAVSSRGERAHINPPFRLNHVRYTGQFARGSGLVLVTLTPVPTAVKAALTRLLTSTEYLMESLMEWNKGAIPETGVIQAFTWMEHDFNRTVDAFTVNGVSMSELMSVPDKLWTIIGIMRGTPENKARFLPSVHAIIKKLVVALLAKRVEFTARPILNKATRTRTYASVVRTGINVGNVEPREP
ncbi:Bud site selection protein 6 [Ceratobasidium sp. 423]|nr:Bud site selection protein 6 [Ceratobasidium sp. 423]